MANKRKPKTPDVKRAKRRTDVKEGEQLAPVKKHNRSLDLKDWLAEIDTHAKMAADSGSPKGACLIPNPQTGGNDCIRTDETTCSKLGGTWIGGPCGPD
jgi:hypothetical protein